MFKFTVMVPVLSNKVGQPELIEPISETSKYLFKNLRSMIKEFIRIRCEPLCEAKVKVVVKYRETKRGISWELKI